MYTHTHMHTHNNNLCNTITLIQVCISKISILGDFEFCETKLKEQVEAGIILKNLKLLKI